MCVIYFIVFVIVPFVLQLLISDYTPRGYFRLGRLADLIQLDLVIFFLWRIWFYERIRWRRLVEFDRKEAEK